MAKVKRMMFGGAAKAVAGALGGAKKAVAAKSAAQQAAPKPVPAFARPYVDKMMSATRTQSQMQGAAKPKMGLGAAMAKPAMGLGAAMANRNLGRVGAGAARGFMKKGGAVKKKATKK